MMQDKFGVRSIRSSEYEMMAALYLQVSIVSQALIFVTRSRSWSFLERPGLLLVSAFLIAQLVSIIFRVIILTLNSSLVDVFEWATYVPFLASIDVNLQNYVTK